MIHQTTIKEKTVKGNRIELYKFGDIYAVSINDVANCFLTMKKANAAYKKVYMMLSKGLTVDEVEEAIYEE